MARVTAAGVGEEDEVTAALVRQDSIVARVDKARALLAEARDATDAKKVADIAAAAEIYARRQKLSKEAIDYAHAIMVDAITLMGEMLKAAEKAMGAKGNPGGRGAKIVRSTNGTAQPATLASSGISKRESSDAQMMAHLKKTKPDLHEKVRERKATIATARLEVKRQRKREELTTKAQAAKVEAAKPDAPAPWEIIHGEVGTGGGPLAKLPIGSVRLVFCDPPYNIGVDYGEGHNDRQDDGEYMVWAGRWVDECLRVLAPDGSLWLLINDEYVADYFALLTRTHGLTLRSWVIWYESFGWYDGRAFGRTHRHLLYCAKDPKRHVFHEDAVTVPSSRLTKYNDVRAAPGGKLLDDVWFDIPRVMGTSNERIPDFPTQLPVALLRRIIGCATDPGDLVLDPCSGSATTGAAALELGRRYVGIERSAQFVELSRLRLKGVDRVAV